MTLQNWGVRYTHKFRVTPNLFGSLKPDSLGVDSFSILFNHRSFEKPIAFSPGFWVAFWKAGCLERMEMEVSPRDGYVFRGTLSALNATEVLASDTARDPDSVQPVLDPISRTPGFLPEPLTDSFVLPLTHKKKCTKAENCLPLKNTTFQLFG